MVISFITFIGIMLFLIGFFNTVTPSVPCALMMVGICIVIVCTLIEADRYLRED